MILDPGSMTMGVKNLSTPPNVNKVKERKKEIYRVKFNYLLS